MSTKTISQEIAIDLVLLSLAAKTDQTSREIDSYLNGYKDGKGMTCCSERKKIISEILDDTISNSSFDLVNAIMEKKL